MNKFLFPTSVNPSYLVFLRMATGTILLLSIIAIWPDFCLVYFFSGLGKIIGHTWRNGEALWKTVHLPYFESVISFEAPYPWLWVIGGWGIALTELIYPVFIFNPKTRNVMLTLILALHVSIAVFLNLYLFSAIMIALNVATYYYPYIKPKTKVHTVNQPINPLPIDSS